MSFTNRCKCCINVGISFKLNIFKALKTNCTMENSLYHETAQNSWPMIPTVRAVFLPWSWQTGAEMWKKTPQNWQPPCYKRRPVCLQSAKPAICESKSAGVRLGTGTINAHGTTPKEKLPQSLKYNFYDCHFWDITSQFKAQMFTKILQCYSIEGLMQLVLV